MDTSDTILAVSSPPGRSVRGLIRISGENLGPVIERIVAPPPLPRQLSPGRIHGSLPCLSLFHPAPYSFTAQDILEIQIPGNPALIQRALHGLLESLRQHDPGARLAEPGEFTQRAFLAGRIDLTRAEGIAATIGAVSDAQLQAARLLRTGKLGRWAENLVDRLAQLLALVEAGIDFTDQDDVVPISPKDLDAGLAAIETELQNLTRRSRSWSALEALPWVVLVGPPNAGKSTLFNALLGRERAVVSPIAGTTRDVLAEPLKLSSDDGRESEVMLVDLAGLDPAEGLINRSMQSAARDAIALAELVVLLSDRREFPNPPRMDVPSLRIRTKSDLIPLPPREGQGEGETSDGGKRSEKQIALPSSDSPSPGLSLKGEELDVSAVTGAGLDNLRAAISRHLQNRAVTLAGQMLALTPRHQDELAAATRAIEAARQLLRPHLGKTSLPDMELSAEQMRDALDHLGALGGQVTSDDIIGRIFATFCIGK